MRTVVLLIGLFVAVIVEAQVIAAAVADSPQDATAAKSVGAAAIAPAPRETTATEHVPSANPLWRIPLSGLTSTRERPVFSPSRRPPPPVEVAKVAPPPPPPPPKPAEPEKVPLALQGTVLGEGGERIGLFMALPELKPMRLKVGEDHKGWILREVKQRQVRLEKGRENAVLELPRRDNSKAGPAPRPETAATPPQPAVPPQQAVLPQPAPPQQAVLPQPAPPQPVPPQQVPQEIATIVFQPPMLEPPPQVNPFAGSVHLR